MENKKNSVNIIVKNTRTHFWTESLDTKYGYSLDTKMKCTVWVPSLTNKGGFGLLKIDVPAKCVTPARRIVKDENGNIVKDIIDGTIKTEPIPGYSNIYLGHNDSAVALHSGGYVEAGDIKKHYDDAKKAVKRAAAAKKVLSDASENMELSSDKSYQA